MTDATLVTSDTPVESPRDHVRDTLAYLAFFFIVPLIFLLAPFVAERLPLTQGLVASRFGPILDFSYESKGTDADIVLFGDSSAIYGVDTMRISRELGLKVINLPGTMGSLPVTGSLPLRRYLASNKPPRLIVFYLSPWDLDVLHGDNRLSFEGDEQILRHGTWREIAHLVRTRPKDVLFFPIRFYASPSKVTDFLNLRQSTPAKLLQGFTPNPMKRTLKSDCVFPDQKRQKASSESAQMLARQFASSSTRTLIYLAPIPDCNYAQEVAAINYSEIGNLAPAILPAEDFSADLFYAHIVADRTASSTDLLARQIQNVLDLR